jgi:heptosyltransferase-1
MGQRFLVVRTSAIGDVVFAGPFAAALKRTYPDCHVAWLVEPGIHELLLADPHVDELILWPKNEWKRLWQTRQWASLWQHYRQLRAQLRAGRFDCAFDLQGLLKSGWLTWLSAAPQRIGLGSREGSQWLMTRVLPKGGAVQRISSEYLYLAEQLGLQTGDFLPQLYSAPSVQASAAALLAEQQLQPGRYAVLAPYTTRPQKHWTNAGWVALAALLQSRLGLTPLLLGGPGDVAAAQALAAQMPGVRNAVGRTRIPEAVELIRQAALVVGVDTGLTHMGIATATPTVCLFGSTCPYLDTGRPQAQVIWLGLPCSPCRRRPTCGGSYHCLSGISPAQVLQQAQAVLAARGGA